MRQIEITPQEEGQRLDHLLGRYLESASKGFLYKMLRKKNITLNGKKAGGGEKLRAGDVVRLWLSEETLEKFTAPGGSQAQTYPYQPLPVIYEDEHVIFVNKSAGMLSQKGKEGDASLCEYLIGYLLREKKVTDQSLRLFRPSVCNRLDRNTTGLVACGVSMTGLQQLSTLLRERSIRKFYRCLVSGRLERQMRLEGWLVKSGEDNRVRVLDSPGEGARRIVTAYRPLAFSRQGADWTYLEVELITGRSHQIRAHLSSVGHPILGDPKYGDCRVNEAVKKRFGVTGQLLHAYRMEMPALEGPLAALSQKTLVAPVPPVYEKILSEGEKVTYGKD